MRKISIISSLAFITLLLGSMVIGIFPSAHASALSGSSFSAGHIIDDSVFYNPGAMGASDIQSFLNAKVPTCDTNGTTSKSYYYNSSTGRINNSADTWVTTSRATYGARYDTWYKTTIAAAPYTCLKSYSQNTPAKAAESGLCGNLPAYTGRTAAQIIADVSAACGINPQVMIVLLQKEQGLVTDVWPWDNQYQKATGYACPDTSGCDTTYYGYFNQVYYAARQFKRYRADPTNWNYVAGQSNKIYYNPNTACGYSWVTIQNQATAGLYDYTPYQPNKAALNNLYGSGDSCSAYGNRNFWRYFNDWFGSPTSPSVYSWAHVSQGIYSDAARNNLIPDNAALSAGQTVYFRMVAKNTGNRVWYPPMVKLGTANPYDRVSQVQDSSWPKANRAALLKEDSVSPGGNGTFEGSFTIPADYTGYKEYFNLVADGVTWFNNIGAYFSLYVPRYDTTTLSVEAYANPERTNRLNPNAISTYTGLKLYMRVKIKNTGNQTLPGATTKLATTNPNDRLSAFSDSSWLGPNRVSLIKEGDLAPDAIGTFEFTMTAPDTVSQFNEQFGIVIESLRWVESNTATYNIDVKTRPSDTLTSGQRLNPGQEILSSDGRFRFRFQEDGNLVLYTPNGYTWSSKTTGMGGAYLILQGDGNLVIYTVSKKPVWHTKTNGNGSSRLVMQSDGNAVIYRNSDNKYTWQTRTNGKL